LTWIKSAREKLATAELELLSSTSDATSELWTEEGIVRQPGKAQFLEIVAYRKKPIQRTPNSDSDSKEDKSESEVPGEVHIGNLEHAYLKRVLRLADDSRPKIFTNLFGRFRFKPRKHAQVLDQSKHCKQFTRNVGEEDTREIMESDARKLAVALSRQEEDGTKRAWELMEKLANQPPNLTLNVHNAISTSRELWAFASVGVVLQFVIALIPALMTYHWRTAKGTKAVQDYAYPTFLTGTCLLVVGIALCSYIIEATTVEHVFVPTDGYDVKNIFRLQLEQNMGDQPYKSYVLVNHPGDRNVRTSRYNPEGMDEHSLHPRTETQKPTVIVAVALCFTGFICQFVGLRALHWSATALQLGITLLMTFIRAWIRRGISNQPKILQISDTNLNWIALALGTACRSVWPTQWEHLPKPNYMRFQPCGLIQDLSAIPIKELITFDDPRIKLREMLQSFSPKIDEDLFPILKNLNRTIDDFRRYCLNLRHDDIIWEHVLEIHDNGGNVPSHARLKVCLSYFGTFDLPVIHAILALWRYQNRTPLPLEGICVAKVVSEDDWMAKRDFLKVRTGVKGRCILMSGDGRILSRSGNETWVENSFPNLKCHGLSIENLQEFSGPSEARGSRRYGYLVVTWRSQVYSDHMELLAGFMDAYWLTRELEYDIDTNTWYTNVQNVRRVVEVDVLIGILMRNEMVATEKDAKILVYASLARCTIWKQFPGPDGYHTASDQQPGSSRPKVATTYVNTQQQDRPASSASGTAPAKESPQTDTATTEKSESHFLSATSTPTAIVMGDAPIEGSSNMGTMTAEASVTRPNSTLNTSVPRAHEVLHADTDKGKRAAASSTLELQSTSTARPPVTTGVTIRETGESPRTGARRAEATED